MPKPALNKPSQAEANMQSKHATTSGNPAEGAIFRESITVRETRLRQTFTPSAPALIEISRVTFAELLTDDAQIGKTILPEFLGYYSTALLWLRIIYLKQKNSQPLTEQEQDILTLTQTTVFSVPEPILLQLRQLGNIVTKTGQHLYPEFPPLPVELINQQPGYYGALRIPAQGVNNLIHNLYEELPCLGVLAEAVRTAISDQPAGPYQSSLNIDQANTVNQNLLGFKPLGIRRPKAKNLAFAASVTAANFPNYPTNTAFNFELLNAISSVISTTKTFKVSDVVFTTLSETGAQSQVIVSRTIVQLQRTNLQGETRPTSLSSEDPADYGAAVFFDSQLVKEAGLNNNNAAWCCVDVVGGTPPAWIANRNIRRNLPIQYMQEVFQALPTGCL
ncbi:uncharacterized protein [Diabrotica undecimpunctata]|uniref:uncharacterized protein n=1 Tax=Diabrotica undecimpunctata TaxID=50387 RepID=UPI003B6330F8